MQFFLVYHFTWYEIYASWHADYILVQTTNYYICRLLEPCWPFWPGGTLGPRGAFILLKPFEFCRPLDLMDFSDHFCKAIDLSDLLTFLTSYQICQILWIFSNLLDLLDLSGFIVLMNLSSLLETSRNSWAFRTLWIQFNNLAKECFVSPPTLW